MVLIYADFSESTSRKRLRECGGIQITWVRFKAERLKRAEVKRLALIYPVGCHTGSISARCRYCTSSINQLTYARDARIENVQQTDETAWETGDGGDDSAHAKLPCTLVVARGTLCVHCEMRSRI